MAGSNFLRHSKVPTKITTRKSAPTTTNFAKGINTYKPNDLMRLDELHLAQDGRFDRIGEYKTRKGLDRLSTPVGKTKVFDNFSSSYEMSLQADDNIHEIQISPAPNTVIYSISLKIRREHDDYTVFKVVLYADDDPGTFTAHKIAESCVDMSTIPLNEDVEIEIPFVQAPDAPQSFFIGTTEQNPFHTYTDESQNYYNEPLIAAVNDGMDIMCKVHTATKGQVTSIFEANLSDSTGALTDKSILFTFATAGDTSGNETLYRLAENGTLTSFTTLKTDGHPVRYSQDASIIRCVYGNTLTALNPTTPGGWGWQVSTIPTNDLETGTNLEIKLSNILSGPEDNLLYFDAATTTQMVWTWPYGGQYVAPASYSTTTAIPKYNPDTPHTTVIAKSNLTALDSTKPVSQIKVGDYVVYYKDIEGDTDKGEIFGKVTIVGTNNVTVASDPHISVALNSYDEFDRDFRQNFPTINSGDPLTAMINLAGIVYVFTQRHKYQISFESVDVWNQAKCSADGGTFSQESVVAGTDRAYFANPEGIYVFDGFNEVSLTKSSIQNTYDAIPNKEKIRLEFYNNRLYVFCPSTDDVDYGICLVYNANLDLWESFDSHLYIGAVFAHKSPSNRFICGHSRMGVLMLAETEANKYDDMGAPIHFELDTAYQHFDAPSQLKRITKWRPEFATVDVPYTVQCGYALDGTDDVKYAYSINLKNNTIINEHYVWGYPSYPSNYGVQIVPTVLTTIPKVYNEFRRCQIRYQHIAAFEPVNFKSHTLTIQTQRIR
jgi:hypothetical protein